MAIAIISVVATAVVAIVVPFINARLEQQRLQYQATQERFSELRTLLDEAAQRLTEAQTVIVELITRSGGSPPKQSARNGSRNWP
jgi:type II secretory pathway pseudopilin PulG